MKTKIKALLAVMGLGLGVAALPAQAHDHDWHGRGDHDRYDRGWNHYRDDDRWHGGRGRFIESRPYWEARPVYREYYAPPRRAWCPPVYERYERYERYPRDRGVSIVLSVPLF